LKKGKSFAMFAQKNIIPSPLQQEAGEGLFFNPKKGMKDFSFFVVLHIFGYEFSLSFQRESRQD
jgi:hypothetical protein